MSYDSALAIAINEKYRRDALRVFISGLKKPLSYVLFWARPSDMPTALALAQEVEAVGKIRIRLGTHPVQQDFIKQLS